jgi:2-phosphoglycolate phosphatase
LNASPFAVVFDLDGTLVDSREDIVRATQFTLRQHGARELTAEVIASFVGDGARVLLARAWQLPESDPALDAYLSTFLAYYTAHAADFTRPMPGAIETLDALRAFPLGLATNKPRQTTDAVLRELGLAPRFRCIVAGGDLPTNKPDPAVLRHVAGALGIAPGALVMIGDGRQDIRAGKAVGAATIGVLGGFGTEEELVAAGADVVLPSLHDVPRVVHELMLSGR